MLKRGLFAKQAILMLVEADLSDRRMLAVLEKVESYPEGLPLRAGACFSRGC